jgi:hypothetical protein
MDWAAELAKWIREMYTDYRIVDVDPVLRAAAEWFTTSWGGWLSRNVLAVSIIGNALAWLKIKAIRTPSVTDDRIVGYLQWLFTGPWRKR